MFPAIYHKYYRISPHMSSSFFIGVKGISTIRRPEEENMDVDLVNHSWEVALPERPV